MAYQVLARKWRPQDFSSLVGQQPIVTALQNALTGERVAQAYLFSGIRGVGKTTAARVLAKALNCERGPAANPCNDCQICTEITAGHDMDVIEVDAATYSKVEQVRELTEALRYGPARDRYKVVVLDEVHRLSRQAFDALLKIVEEPPPHLVFVFATTEIDAVPATILSRCQEFQFRRVPSVQLAAHLRTICDAEGIDASDTALRLIARAGEGSVRDSVALLDQLATFGDGAISDHDAQDLLGGLDAAIFHQLLAAIVSGDSALVVAQARDIESHGWDPHNVYGQFLGYVRDALHLALGGDATTVDLPPEEAERLGELARRARYENLLRVSQLLLDSEQIVRRSEYALLALEIAWLRACELPKLTRIEDLLARGGAAGSASPAPLPTGGGSASGGSQRGSSTPGTRGRGASSAAVATPPARPQPAPPRPATASAIAADRRPEAAAAQGSSQPPPRAPEANPGRDPSADIERFLELLSTRRQPLAAHFRQADELEVQHGELRVRPSPGDRLLGAALERKANTDVLEEILRELWGDAARWRILPPRNAAASDAPASSSLTAASDEEIQHNPVVQAVLDIFNGTIAKHEPAAGSPGDSRR